MFIISVSSVGYQGRFPMSLRVRPCTMDSHPRTLTAWEWRNRMIAVPLQCFTGPRYVHANVNSPSLYLWLIVVENVGR